MGAPAYIKGVPHPLPPGETVLWEGAPSTRAIATHVFHWRLFAGYFAAMLLLWLVSTDDVFGSGDFLRGLSMRAGLSAIVMVIVVVLSRLVSATSWYAITNRRVVLRLGMVFPMSINIPFTLMESAGIGTFKDGTGQVVLSLSKAQRIAYVALWPHCRVFTFDHPQPVLRGLTEPARVGAILANAVAEAAAADGVAPVQRGAGRDAAPDATHGTQHDAHGVPQPAGV